LSGAILYKFLNNVTIIAIAIMKIMAIIEIIIVTIRLTYPGICNNYGYHTTPGVNCEQGVGTGYVAQHQPF